VVLLNSFWIITLIYGEVKNGKIDGINVTVPFKKSVIPFLDELTSLADEVQSVNTIYKENQKVIGHNTDVGGFKQSLEYINYSVKNKKVFILGAGGVVPSILKALEKLEAAKVYISNRTKEKAKDLESYYKIPLGLETLDWGQSPDFDIIINATSLGLKNNDKIELDYNKHKPKFFGKKKLFYDIIYNPGITNFLLKGEELGNETTNGKMMFVCQAQLAFKVWHNILPKIDNETIKLLGDQTTSLSSISKFWSACMIRIAVLGDVGSGKSYVAKQFGYPVFNADAEVAKLYSKNRKCYNKLRKALPEYIVSFPVKKIEISKAIIADQHNLKKIVKIVHPEVRSSMNNFIKKNKHKKFVILDIPLLMENKINKKKDILIFVDAKKKEINKRLKKKLNINPKIMEKFKKLQLPVVLKKKKSDFIIKNNFKNNSIKKNVKRMMKKILLNDW